MEHQSSASLTVLCHSAKICLCFDDTLTFLIRLPWQKTKSNNKIKPVDNALLSEVKQSLLQDAPCKFTYQQG